ncbi:MAG: FtsX-like permease family protein [Deltaproteobacteria bacterium]|nr:MAG: FtsX-like permease family protein [Deltaproteobacteria bacterium]
MTEATQLHRLVSEEVEGLDYVIERGRGWARFISETQSLQASVASIKPDDEGRLLQHLGLAAQSVYKAGGEGRVLGDLRQMQRPHAVLLFAAQAARLGVDVGDTLTVTAETPTGQTNTVDGEVVAIADDLGFISHFATFVNKQLLLDLYHFDADTTGALLIFLKDISRASEVMGKLRTSLQAHGFRIMDHLAQPFFTKFEIVAGEDWTGQKLDLTTWEDELGMMKWILNALNSVAVFLVSVLLLIIVVGLSNSMWMAVRERTQEIGTLRAIGMQRSRVALSFLLEALILGLLGTLSGSLLGAGIAALVNWYGLPIRNDAVRMILMSEQLRLSVRGLQVVGSVATFTVVTALAALWPALRAARLRPVTAINRLD